MTVSGERDTLGAVGDAGVRKIARTELDLLRFFQQNRTIDARHGCDNLSTWRKCELVLSFQGEIAIVERVGIKN